MDKNHYIVDEKSAHIVRKIFELAKSGKLPTEIAKEMTKDNAVLPSEVVGNVHTRNQSEIKRGWNRNTVVRILRNETYLGRVRNGMLKKISYKSKKVLISDRKDWIVVDNMHEPLVDEETFSIVQELIASRTRVRTKKYEWLLKGIIECEECGKKLSILVHPHKTSDKITTYLRCNTYAGATSQKLCTPHSSNLEQVTDIVIKQVKKRCKDFIIEEEYCKTGWSLTSKINSRKNIINNEIALLKKQLNDWNQKIDKIYDDKVSSLITEEDFKRLYIKFIENRDATQKSIEELEMSNDEKEKVVDVIKIVKNFLKMKEITRTMLVQLVDKVTINEQKEITIYYKFKLLNMKAIKNNEEEIVNQNIC